MYDYRRWPNFGKDELVCQHTGLENPNEEEFIELMDLTQELRTWYGKPLIVTSCYRHPTHPIEARKPKPGQHSLAAIDFRVPPEDSYMVASKMFKMGYRGIGINLTGDFGSRFIHGDLRKGPKALWSY